MLQLMNLVKNWKYRKQVLLWDLDLRSMQQLMNFWSKGLKIPQLMNFWSKWRKILQLMNFWSKGITTAGPIRKILQLMDFKSKYWKCCNLWILDQKLKMLNLWFFWSKIEKIAHPWIFDQKIENTATITIYEFFGQKIENTTTYEFLV